ncbi:MAG: YIP1 family protein [Roseovarius sp.]|jgi:ABC-type multidrug transport system fused ATPase/permease subunit|uniref:YIP1 family protein n=1 Tax=Roseovarius sp. TaxID=1486281 RepID=UPI0032EFA475
MPVTSDIVATYRGPRRVVRRLLDIGEREDRALILVITACVLIFVAQAPWQARLAHFDPSVPIEARLYWSSFFWILIMPLLLYLLAFLSHLVARTLGGNGSGYGARIALFWAFLAVSPVSLLLGIVAGFVGPGPGLQGVGLIWCGVFGWFWLSGLREAEWSSA